MATIDTISILSKVEILKKNFENVLLNNSHTSATGRSDFLESMIKELGTNIVTPYLVSILNNCYYYDYVNNINKFLKEDIQSKIIFIKEWTPEKFISGKKIYQYFKKINLKYYELNETLSYNFHKYYEDTENYNENSIIDNVIYTTIMESDLVVRFINAFSRDARYIPGEFVTVKLGIMPGRILDNLPAQSRTYVRNNNNNSSLYSPGIILDIIDNRKVEVKNRGRWYKVAVSTPFAIFCVEERHLRKYNPTKEHISELFNSSIQKGGNEK